MNILLGSSCSYAAKRTGRSRIRLRSLQRPIYPIPIGNEHWSVFEPWVSRESSSSFQENKAFVDLRNKKLNVRSRLIRDTASKSIFFTGCVRVKWFASISFEDVGRRSGNSLQFIEKSTIQIIIPLKKKYRQWRSWIATFSGDAKCSFSRCSFHYLKTRTTIRVNTVKMLKRTDPSEIRWKLCPVNWPRKTEGLRLICPRKTDFSSGFSGDTGGNHCEHDRDRRLLYVPQQTLAHRHRRDKCCILIVCLA